MAKKKKVFLNNKRYGYRKRKVNTRDVRQRFLIVCEGTKTEPKYFKKFRVSSLVLEVKGVGCNTVDVVNEALKSSTDTHYDQIWCVFDRDTFPVDRFNMALELARNNNIQVAYSNQAFELWYLLHFQYLNTAIGSEDYFDRLGKHLGYEYQKNNETIFDEIIHLQDNAIRNAERLYAEYNPPNPAQDNPSTTVHLLIKELNRYSIK